MKEMKWKEKSSVASLNIGSKWENYKAKESWMNEWMKKSMNCVCVGWLKMSFKEKPSFTKIDSQKKKMKKKIKTDMFFSGDID